LTGLGNAVRIAVDNPKGSIYDAAYLETLRQLSEKSSCPGVARNQMKSLWTPATRWVGVTEDGLEGGPVIPDGYDGAASLAQLQANIARSGEIGQLVAFNGNSSVIYVPLLVKDGDGQGSTTACSPSSKRCAPSTNSRASPSTSPASPNWWAT
jgi:hypothetical protein